MNLLSRLFLVLLLFALIACSSARERPKVTGRDASPDALPDLVGTYSVNGFDPLGVEYGGLLTIQPGDKPGEYKLQWIITGSVQEGVGVIQGNQLIVEWRSVQARGQNSRGRTIYTITTKGELYGERTVEGYDQPGTEEAFPNDEDWGKFRIGR
ncbi:MAG: hypothetical protein GXP42_08775 [Chloroflexi bacterium]|nr:hypothetical protein [Chloroflexota bacterium]